MGEYFNKSDYIRGKVQEAIRGVDVAIRGEEAVKLSEQAEKIISEGKDIRRQGYKEAVAHNVCRLASLVSDFECPPPNTPSAGKVSSSKKPAR